MRYSSTTRILNLVFFAILFAGFGALGIWAGILVAPFMCSQVGPIDLPSFSVGLAWELGAFGIAGMILAGIGLVHSILSMVHANDDSSVRSALSCYVGLGFLVAIFLFLNGAWLYRLTTTNFDYSDLGFAIAFFIVLSIIIAIAVSVPFVKMHGDDVNQNPQMSLIAKIFFSINAGIAIPGVLSIFFSMNYPRRDLFITKLIVVSLIPLAAALLSLIALLGYNRGQKNGTVSKANGYLFEGSLLLDGLGFLAAGCFSYLAAENEGGYQKYSIVASEWTRPDVNYLDFSVMSWILGGLLILFVFGLVISSFRPVRTQNPEA